MESRGKTVLWLRTVGRVATIAGALLATCAATIWAGRGIGEARRSTPTPTARLERATEVFTTAPAPPSVAFTGAKYEPLTGCYLGAYIDLDPLLKRKLLYDKRVHRDPREFEKITQKKHAMYFFYMGYGRPFPSNWVNKLASMNKFVHIALEPNRGLDAVKNDAYLLKLAKSMGASKAKIFLRFASEMNGDWVNYWGEPKKYVEKWRLLHKVFAKHAPNVAMVWCPYAIPMHKAVPYYPGDKYVDWVGVNFYNVTYFNQNPLSPARGVTPLKMLDDVYRLYANRKPIMICEYGATHYSALEGVEDPDYAIKCIRELYGALKTTHQRVKAINYFNTNNMHVKHRRNNDYSVTSNYKVLTAYRDVIASSHFLAEPRQDQDDGL